MKQHAHICKRGRSHGTCWNGFSSERSCPETPAQLVWQHSLHRAHPPAPNCSSPPQHWHRQRCHRRHCYRCNRHPPRRQRLNCLLLCRRGACSPAGQLKPAPAAPCPCVRPLRAAPSCSSTSADAKTLVPISHGEHVCGRSIATALAGAPCHQIRHVSRLASTHEFAGCTQVVPVPGICMELQAHLRRGA